MWFQNSTNKVPNNLTAVILFLLTTAVLCLLNFEDDVFKAFLREVRRGKIDGLNRTCFAVLVNQKNIVLRCETTKCAWELYTLMNP